MIVVTERAARQACKLALRDGREPVLRVGVRGGGCSGLSYFTRFDAQAAEDQAWTAHGLTVVCDPKSLRYVDGCELDFDAHILRGGFRFRNPQAKANCSCGESFSI